ncbi:MAG: hypothetical protein AAF438_12775 [Pseudomonadota bacterium]
MKKQLAYLLVGILLVGCTTHPRTTIKQAKLSEIVCLKEPATGTRILEERCYTKAQLAKIRSEARLWLQTGGEMGGFTMVRPKPYPK